MAITVLHLLGPLRPSGMERMLTTAAEGFLDEQVKGVVVGQGDDHTFMQELEGAGYAVYTLQHLGRSLEAVRELKRIVRRHNVDIIHIHTEGDYLRTTIAARWCLGRHGALVRTIHSIFDARGRWYWRRLGQALFADFFVAAIIAPSQDVADNERRFGRLRARVVLNWVDERFFAVSRSPLNEKRGSQPPIAAIVGNCSPIKQHELALDAIMAAGHLVWHVGDELRANLRERVLLDQMQEAGLVVSRGVQVPDRALAKADYFVFPSSHEGMGVALAEAIAAGVPAFVNDVPGVQWARGIKGVKFVGNTDSAWREAILGWPFSVKVLTTELIAPDLSAPRGVREYAEIYRQALS